MDTLHEHKMLPGSLELAYIGDTVYDYYVRRALIGSGAKVHTLHRQAIGYVCAHGQSESFRNVESLLSEEEHAVVRRGRNVHQNPPHNADPAEYRRATGFEALLGYLDYTNRQERITELMHRALPDLYPQEDV